MADEDNDLPPDPLVPEDETAERAKLQQKRRRARAADVEAAEFWRSVLADRVGRREIWALLENCHTFEERFACGPNGFPQDLATWYQSGERDVGLRLWRSLLRIAPDGVLDMQREHDPVFKDAPKRKPARRVRGMDV